MQEPVAEANMGEDEDLDEEAILQRALLLSKAEGEAAATQGAAEIKAAEQQNEFKYLLKDNEFIKDIAKELGIEGMEDLQDQPKTDEQKKKEEEDKK